MNRLEALAQLPDQAMNANGGIDFTANKTPLEVRNAGEGIKFKMDRAMLQQLRDAPDFRPVIISIRPMGDLRSFLLNTSPTY